jgi:cyclophilin family peptidyl-prolyl cis-trans isomerase
MRAIRTALACLLGVASATLAQEALEKPTTPVPEIKEATAMPVVTIETSLGTIKAELFADKAPLSVTNFLAYADKGTYDGTIFHRVINGFMIQGGGFTPDMSQRPTAAPVKNEARSDVPNARGTLAMARTSVIDSATCQFFINLKDNGFLNHTAKTPQGYGYAVFGRVVEGMDIVDQIAKVPTGTHPAGHGDVPTTPVVIKSVKRAVEAK